MKITAFFLFIVCLQVQASGYGQGITLSEKDVSISKIFREINKQTGYFFLFNDQLLQNAKKVSIDVKNGSLEEVLKKCFKDQPFEYSIQGKTIIVRRKQEARLIFHDIQVLPISVTGKVTDIDGNALAGATVAVKGETKVTTTDENGFFSLKEIASDGILQISFVGYERSFVPINNRTFISIKLKLDIGALNEVTINKGYYTEIKRLSTSNISRITSKDIEKQAIQNPLLALQGRIPGVTVIQNSGVPGAGITVQIQGVNSISSVIGGLTGNDPLYIIDGVPYVSQLLPTTRGGGGFPILGRSGGSSPGNPLSYINPQDIESIEILKDADATAIYGSRAANGAILITTRKGKSGPIRFEINIQQGIGTVSRKLKLLDTDEYLTMRREAFKNNNVQVPSINTNPNDGNYDVNGLWAQDRYTDWQKVLIGNNANYSNVQLNLAGGTKASQYRIGLFYNRSTSVFPGSFNDKRSGVNFNISSTSTNRKFNVEMSGSYLNDNNGLPAIDFTQFIFLAPNAPTPYQSDNSINWEPAPSGKSSWDNPFAYLNNTYDNKTKNFIGNASLSYHITGDLEIKANFGGNILQTDELVAQPRSVVNPESRAFFNGLAYYTKGNISSWIVEPQISYDKKISQGILKILVGSSTQNRVSNGQAITGQGYDNDQVLKDMSAATSLRATSVIDATYRYFGLFGRVNYTLKEKYIINITGRRDGSSRFGPKSRFHNFWSVGTGWIFSDENLIKERFPALSFGKIRASYGTTGNDQIGDYSFMNLYTTQYAENPYQGLVGRIPTTLNNPYLEWEETRKLQAGIDLTFWQSRLSISGNYVFNTSSNQLVEYALPRITGFSSIVSNFPAVIHNTSWEFAVNTKNINSKSITWSTSLNFTITRNKLARFPDLEKSTYSSNLIVGQPLGAIYTYRFSGVNPLTGLYEVLDVNGNPTSSPNFLTDRTVLINTQPKFYGGIENSITIKGLTLDFLFQFTKQLGGSFVLNGTPGRFNAGKGNQPIEVLNRWQKAGDITSIEKFTQNRFAGIRGDASYADASFIKLRNILLSYQIPLLRTKVLQLQSWKVFLQGQNLLTITNFKGFDPEIQNTIAVPPLRLITVGISIIF